MTEGIGKPRSYTGVADRGIAWGRRGSNAVVVLLLVGTLLAGIAPTSTAAVTNNNLCNLKYQGSTDTPSVASGSFVPTGTLLTFGVASTLAAPAPTTADLLTIRFPHGTSFAANLTPADFTIQQSAANSGGAPCTVAAGNSGTTTGPRVAGSKVDAPSYTVTLQVQAASLSTGSNAGKGLVTVALLRADAIRFPTCAPMALPLTVTHWDAPGATKKAGAVDNPFTFTLGGSGQGCTRFLEQPQNTGRGLPFVPVVRVKVTDTSGAPLSGQSVALEVTGAPAGVWLANGPGQDIQPTPPGAPTPPAAPMAGPVATTDANGIASFPGLTLIVDGVGFPGAGYQLHAATSRGWVDSEPFRVGRTSPPWMQHNFNPQRTGWSPNIADFSDPANRTIIGHVQAWTLPEVFWHGSFGDVATTPILVDLNGDGVLDLGVANRVKQGMVGTTNTALLAFDLSSCASTCSAAPLLRLRIFGGIGPGNGHGIPDGNMESNLAAVYAPGRNVPTVLAAGSTNHATAAPFTGVLYAINDGAFTSSMATSVVSIPPLAANIGPGGVPAMAVMVPSGPGQTGVSVLPLTASGGFGPAMTTSYASGTRFGGALSSAEMRPGNLVPEIVMATAQQASPTGATGSYGTTQGWASATLAICSPTATAPSCTETTTLADTAILGLSLADLDGDGRPDVVATGSRSGTAAGLYGPSLGQLSVYKGSIVPIGNPLRLVEGADVYNTAALANIDTADQSGSAAIVTVDHGAPPTDDYASGDSYSVSGSVRARDLNAASTAIADQGVWTRLTGESPGGGILLTLDPSPAHGYRPDFLFASSDGTVTATRVTDATTTNPPAQMWSMGNLGTSSSNDASQGIPMAPLVAGDVTGDCHAEIFAGLSGGSAGRGEVAILKGRDAEAPGAPRWDQPNDYDISPVSSAWTGSATPDQDTAPGHGFKAKLAWNRPDSDGGLPVVAYKVYRTTGLPAGAGPTGSWDLVGVWPSGTPPTFNAAGSPAYRPFIDRLAGEGDYYYRVAAMTCFTLANDADGVGAFSAPFYVEARFGTVADARAIPSGSPAFPAPVQVVVAWERFDNAPRPHGCGWVDSYNLYKSTSATNIIAAANKIASPWPVAGGASSPATFAVADTNVVRAGWNGLPDANGNGAGGIYYYAVNPVNCVGERNVDPNPPYNDPPPTLVMANTRVPKAPNLAPLTVVTSPTGIKLDWTADPAVNGCAADTAGLGGTILGYNIYRGTSPGGETLYDTVQASGPVGPPAAAAPWWSPNPSSAPSPGAVATTYTDTNVVGGVQYYYQVTTINCVGESLRSFSRTLAQLPEAPTGLTARPFGDPAYAATGPKKVRLEWTALGAGQWGGCTGGQVYVVHRGAPGGPYAPQTQLTGTSWTDDGSVVGFPLSTGSSFGYVVSAQCTAPALLESPYSVDATADVLVPDAPVLSGPVMGTGPSLALSWTAPAPANSNCPWLEGYRIYRGTAGSGSQGPTPYATVYPAGISSWPRALYGTAPAAPATTYTDTGVTLGTTYHYTVTAVNCVGESLASNEEARSAVLLSATLTPTSATGTAATTFTVTPTVVGGTPAYTCAWSVSPSSPGWSPPTVAPCTSAATLSGAPGSVYTVTLTVTDQSNPMQTATATSQLTVNPPLDVTIQPGSAMGTPQTLFTLQPSVTGGIPTYACTWSISPPGGTFTPPATDPCVSAATFTGGTVGETYTVLVQAVDADSPPDSAWATATLNVIANQPPVADFQANQPSANPGQPVSFTDASSDVDGVIVSYLWDFGDGTMSTWPSPLHTFARPGIYQVRLTVTDDYGATGWMTRAVDVSFEKWNPQPDGVGMEVHDGSGSASLAADAGADMTVDEGQGVRLSGVARGAADAPEVTYEWRQVAGPKVRLTGTGTASPSFKAPAVEPGPSVTLRFALVVAQGASVSAWDQVEVTVQSANHAPVARAAGVFSVEEGTTGTLDALASTDPDGGKLTFAWVQLTGPSVEIQGADGPVASFVAPPFGPDNQLEFQVTVSDGRVVAAAVQLAWVTPRPTPDATFTFAAQPGEPLTVAFEAVASNASATWDFGDGQTGSGARAVHTYAQPGPYQVRLTVDSPTAKASSTQDVEVEPVSTKAGEAGAVSGAAWFGIALAAVALGLLLVALVARRSREKVRR